MAIQMDVPGGDRIQFAIERAIHISAKNDGEDVEFTFNDVELCVNDKMTPAEAYKQFEEGAKKNALAYRNSPEFKKSQEEYVKRIAVTQDKIDCLLEILPDVLKQDVDAAVKWVGKFADINDNSNLKFDRKAIAQAFMDAGYKRNEFVGDPDVKEHRNLEKEGRWIIGQAIDCLAGGMPILSVASKFADDYAKRITPEIQTKRASQKMKQTPVRLKRRR